MTSEEFFKKIEAVIKDERNWAFETSNSIDRIYRIGEKDRDNQLGRNVAWIGIFCDKNGRLSYASCKYSEYGKDGNSYKPKDEYRVFSADNSEEERDYVIKISELLLGSERRVVVSPITFDTSKKR